MERRSQVGRIGRRTGISALVMLFCAGCAVSKSPPVTVTFAYPAPDFSYLEPLAREFMQAHPQITIQLLPKKWDQLSSLAAEEMDAALIGWYALEGMRLAKGIQMLDALMERDSHEVRTCDTCDGLSSWP
jgi:ABC-type glycerol-3-phosphate transport system substrate-binding protein